MNRKRLEICSSVLLYACAEIYNILYHFKLFLMNTLNRLTFCGKDVFVS